MTGRCESYGKRRALAEYTDILTGVTRWLCWPCASGRNESR